MIIEGYKTEGFDNIVVARSGVDRLRGKSSLDLVDGHTLALACNEALARQAFDAASRPEPSTSMTPEPSAISSKTTFKA